MINIRTIRKLNNNDGLTLKNGKVITYKSGWQVADHGIEAKSAEEAIKAVRAMDGNCGVWFENGIYYIDHSFRVNTKREAIEIAERTIKLVSSVGGQWAWLIAKPFAFGFRFRPFGSQIFDTHGSVDKKIIKNKNKK